MGFLDGAEARAQTSARGAGPAAVITDFGVLTPDAHTRELTLTALSAGVSADEARAAVGWPLAVAPSLATLEPPSKHELETLRALHARTKQSHRRPVEIPA
jgi:glutaconate CoA-transferase subunit B